MTVSIKLQCNVNFVPGMYVRRLRPKVRLHVIVRRVVNRNRTVFSNETRRQSHYYRLFLGLFCFSVFFVFAFKYFWVKRKLPDFRLRVEGGRRKTKTQSFNNPCSRQNSSEAVGAKVMSCM